VNDDMALGDEFVLVVVLAVALELNLDPHDVSLVSEQSLHFFPNMGFHAIGEFEVDARHNDFVRMICLVHGFPYWLTTQNNLRMKSCLASRFIAASAPLVWAGIGNNRFIRLVSSGTSKGPVCKPTRRKKPDIILNTCEHD
jgi:hypothetical protein